jgi:hypothetical protein
VDVAGPAAELPRDGETVRLDIAIAGAMIDQTLPDYRELDRLLDARE